MTLPPEKVRDLCGKFSSLHDGSLSLPEQAALERSLLENAEARRLYVRFSRICAGLDWNMAHPFDELASEMLDGSGRGRGSKNGKPPAGNPAQQPSGDILSFPRTVFLSIAATLAAAAVAFVCLFPWRGPTQPTATRPTEEKQSIAHLGRTADCVWNTGMPDLKPGDKLSAGQNLELASGRAEIHFASGTVVTIDGPASLKVYSENDWDLQRGRLSVRIPSKEQGLVLNTPAVQVTRCSADFAVEVDENKRVGVHVFDGQVEALRTGSKGQEPMQLTAGMAVNFGTSTAKPQVIPPPAPSTESPEFQKWATFSKETRGRADLLGYYPFQLEGDGNTLPNVAKKGVGGIGGVNRAVWKPGRFPGKLALQFDEHKHVMLGVRYRHLTGPFTVATWVAPNRVDLVQRVFASPPWYEPKGFAFGLSPTGVKFTIWRAQECDAPVKLEPNRWVHLVAAVSAAGDVVLYCDGREIGRMAGKHPLKPADEEFFIGSVGHREFFHGLIDELMVFNRQLPASEVAELYQAGRPLQETVPTGK